MTNTSDANGDDYLAQARKNLKTNVPEQRDYDEIGREAGKALAMALFGGFLKNLPTNSTPKVSAAPTGRIDRVAIGTGYFFGVLFTSLACVLVNGWLALGVVVFAVLVCFSRRLKSHGISVFVGVLLLLFVLPMVLAEWHSERRKAELAPLRQSNPTLYLERTRKLLTRNEWLQEAKLLDPKLYQAEYVIDEAARLFNKAVEDKANQKKLEEVAQAEASEVAENQQASCRENWAKCKDNTDIMKNYKNYRDAAYRCKDAANNQASYGTPDWPWGAFETYRTGDSGPKSGEIELIEGHAKFENGFGAMKRVFVRCVYDLNSRKVQYVEIN